MYRERSEAGALFSEGASHAPITRQLGRLESGAKRFADVVGALFLLALFAPLFVFIALGVVRSSPGPIFYSQKRVGKGGSVFDFYKFRSMSVDSDEVLSSFLEGNEEARLKWNAYQKIENDPRITSFGRFIRRSSLDELPQLWNVLRGDMSLVGPRPCMPDQRSFYGAHWSSYCSIRPGLTGLWQVSGRNRLTYHERVSLDVDYVRNWSLWLDLKILVRTVKVVFHADGSH